MTGPATASRPAGGASRTRRRVHLLDAIVLVVVLAAAVLVARLLELPSFVDRLTVVNPTLYDVGIDVTDQDRGDWISVGTARRSATSTFERVIDQGENWIFRLSAQGEDAGELRLTRGELERDGWRFRIPEHVAGTLESKGARPPP